MAQMLRHWLVRCGSSFGLLHPRGYLLDWPGVMAQASLAAQAGCFPLLAAEDRAACEQALRAAEEALHLNPADVLACQARIKALSSLQRFEEALAACEQVGTQAPRDAARMHLQRGQVLLCLARDGAAREAYQQALALAPDDAQILLAEGIACWRLRRLHEALAAFERAIELCPEDGHAYLHKGELLPYLRRFGEALATCDRAIELDPTLARALYAQGVALTGLGWYPEALNAWERAKQIDPALAEADYARGHVLWVLQRPQEAYAAFKQACTLDPRLAPPTPQWVWRWKERSAWSHRGPSQQHAAPPSHIR